VAKHKKPDDAVNTEGWMMSYADMATVLLAMFIVLSTLGKDQTGVSLAKGMESWRDSRQTFGLAGMFQTSSHPDQKSELSPQYIHPEDGQPNAKGAGPDNADGPRSIDGEHEKLNRFLHEMDQQFQVEKLPRVVGSAAVDFFDPITEKPPYLARKPQEVIAQVLPLLSRKEYRVILVVWATTPSDSAWARAAEQARRIADQLSVSAGLDDDARARFVAVGQPWRYAGFQRPVMSLIVARTEKQ
jgi:flagellar motor protein MotB